jgi:hypothetical protein
MALTNAAAANLLAGGDPETVVMELRHSTQLAARVGNRGTQIENLLRIAAAEAARGDVHRAARLHSLWRVLSAPYGHAKTDSNQLLYDRFLKGVVSAEGEEGDADASLETAVAYARGLRPSATDVDR